MAGWVAAGGQRGRGEVEGEVEGEVGLKRQIVLFQAVKEAFCKMCDLVSRASATAKEANDNPVNSKSVTSNNN